MSYPMPPSLGVIHMVKYKDGTIEEFPYANVADANAFTHAVKLYLETGIGEDWYEDIISITPRELKLYAN